MILKIKFVYLCLSYRLLWNFYKVQSTSIKENKPCALDHELHFTNVNTPFALKGRRQQMEDPPLTLLDMMFPRIGPTKGPAYDPSLGYEPYWPGGDWVFSTAPNKTTKGFSGELCGQVCPEVYKSYGRICGRNRSFKYRTFEDYCQMMNDDCKQRADWMIVYRGVCVGEFNLYPNKSASFPKRAEDFISKYMYEHSTKNTFLDLDFFDRLMRSSSKKPNFKELFMDEVQKRHPNYNPNPGHEPYWSKGAWVFEDDEAPKGSSSSSTTRMPLVCGEECNYIFKRVKEVCAKRATTQYTDGCNPSLFQICDGYHPDVLDGGFRTFKTYCEFLNEQCHSTFDYHWIIVHVGKCVPHYAVFKTLNTAEHVLQRLHNYLSTLEDVFYNASLPSPQGIPSTIRTTNRN